MRDIQNACPQHGNKLGSPFGKDPLLGHVFPVVPPSQDLQNNARIPLGNPNPSTTKPLVPQYISRIHLWNSPKIPQNRRKPLLKEVSISVHNAAVWEYELYKSSGVMLGEIAKLAGTTQNATL